MATVLTHAALPLLAGRLWRPKDVPPRQLAWVSVLLALWPDADYLGLLFDVRPEDALGHRGLSHSLLVAAVLAAAAALVAFPQARKERRTFASLFLFLFGAAASHGLVDAAARGDLGVALLAPLWDARLALPFRPLHAIPLGLDESFSRWGALVFAGELLALVVPLALVVRAVEARRAGRRLLGVTVGTAAWLAALAGASFAAPSLFARPPAPALAPADLAGIPLGGLPDGKLVTRFDALVQAGLFGRRLEPRQVPWSSSFFPAWYGSEAGRWQDAKLTLVARTLLGFHGPYAPLSPAEKYDAAVGDAAWTATTHALARSHNGKPRFWFGLCNGVAVAAMGFPEPHRAVDAVSPSGAVVRFHPQDVKALLAASSYWVTEFSEVDERCGEVRLDSGAACSMNPAALVLAAANRLGLARQSFLLDVHPTPQAQYYPVAGATLTVERPPYPLDGSPLAPALQGKVASLVDVALRFSLSSTTLGFGEADRPDPRSLDQTRYERVGLREVPAAWSATLALGPDSEILGGRWNGDPPVGPDNLAFLSGSPLLTDGGMVEFNPGLRWSVVEALARASVDERDGVPRVEVGPLLQETTR